MYVVIMVYAFLMFCLFVFGVYSCWKDLNFAKKAYYSAKKASDGAKKAYDKSKSINVDSKSVDDMFFPPVREEVAPKDFVFMTRKEKNVKRMRDAQVLIEGLAEDLLVGKRITMKVQSICGAHGSPLYSMGNSCSCFSIENSAWEQAEKMHEARKKDKIVDKQTEE